MKTEMNQVLVELKKMNIELKQNCIHLQKLAEKMGIVIDEQQLMSMDMKEINVRLDAMMKRMEEREQCQLKVMQ